MELAEETYGQRRKTPSFSSLLLDSICRSIDESADKELHHQATSMRMRHHGQQQDYHYNNNNEDIPSLRRVDKWMEDRSSTRKSSTKYFKTSYGSTTTSDNSSCCGTNFSSSDTESALVKSPSFLAMETPKRQGKFMRTTKSKASKIYSELKKVKQPISPGGRIASLLNSLFSSRNLKKEKYDNDNVVTGTSSVGKLKNNLAANSLTTTTSSVSRTCLSKTPSTRCNGSKRSVRFCPVTVILEEDRQPCGHKNVYEVNNINRNEADNLVSDRVWGGQRILSFPIVKNQLVLDKKYSASAGITGGSSRFRGRKDHNYVDHDDDDLESCSSSDLFELELDSINGTGIGVGLYAEELPVYGTTKLKTYC